MYFETADSIVPSISFWYIFLSSIVNSILVSSLELSKYKSTITSFIDNLDVSILFSILEVSYDKFFKISLFVLSVISIVSLFPIVFYFLFHNLFLNYLYYY